MAASFWQSSSPERSSNLRSSARRRDHGPTHPSFAPRQPQDGQRYPLPPKEHHQYQPRPHSGSAPPPNFVQPSQAPWSSPAPMTTAATPRQGDNSNGITMERTPSGNAIMSDTPQSYEPSSLPPDHHTLDEADAAAADLVESGLTRLPSHTKHSRILRSLIHSQLPIDDLALASILHSTNLLFFSGALSGRVQWEWSSAPRYSTGLIGTTALRRRSDGNGYECLIVLSEPILRDDRYDRKLLLSAFLHELIHCYLFVRCGFEARRCGGHTSGFHRIASVVDRWVGEGTLRLGSMKADLLHFRKEQQQLPLALAEPKIEGHRGERWYETCTPMPRAETMWLEPDAMMMPSYY